MPTASEVEFQAKLHEARQVDRVCHLSEGRTGDGSVGRSELGMVKEIEQLRPELEIHVFVDRRSLEHGEIEVDHPLLPDGGINPRLVAKNPGIVLHTRHRVDSARRGETGRIEPLADFAHAASGPSLVAPGHVVGPQAADTKPGSCKGVAAPPVQLYREPALKSGDAVQSPTANYPTGKPVRTAEILLAMPERKIEDIADDRTLRHILRR